MNTLVIGGTGFIGQQFINRRLQAGDNVYCLTRDVTKAQLLFKQGVSLIDCLSAVDDVDIDVILNIAGEPILDKRWSDAHKQNLCDSRIKLTNNLVAWISKRERKPSVLISGSAVGYYGSRSDDVLDEGSRAVDGFTHQLCLEWEKAAMNSVELGVRVCVLRTGIVLGDGGVLSRMKLPFQLGLGGSIGCGHQWMSWIHIADVVAIIEMLMTHEHLRGVFNLTAPNAVTNREFSVTLAGVLNRPALLPMPAFLMKLVLGEGAELLVKGQKVRPKALLDSGYHFKYPELKGALLSILSKT